MKKITRRTVLRASGLAAASLALSGCAPTGSACVGNGFSCLLYTSVLANNNYTEVASAVLAAVGGKENVKDVGYCATRLRFEVKDNAKVDEDVYKRQAQRRWRWNTAPDSRACRSRRQRSRGG